MSNLKGAGLRGIKDSRVVPRLDMALLGVIVLWAYKKCCERLVWRAGVPVTVEPRNSA